MTKSLTTHLNVAVPAELKKRLQRVAQIQRRSLSNTVRVLLEEALDFWDAQTPEPEHLEYEAYLTVEEAALLVKQGYRLQSVTSPTKHAG